MSNVPGTPTPMIMAYLVPFDIPNYNSQNYEFHPTKRMGKAYVKSIKH